MIRKALISAIFVIMIPGGMLVHDTNIVEAVIAGEADASYLANVYFSSDWNTLHLYSYLFSIVFLGLIISTIAITILYRVKPAMRHVIP